MYRTADDGFAIDAKLFKLVGFYQMVDPNGSTIFGYNAHRFAHVLMVAFTSSYTLVGLSGVFYRPDGAPLVYSFKDMQTLFYIACITVGNLKMVTIVRNAEAIRRLFSVRTGRADRAAISRLADCRKRFASIFPWYVFMFANTAFAWMVMPVVLNRGSDGSFRRTNVVNLRYPVAAETYDEFYVAFYAMECVVTSYSALGLVLFDVFLIASLQLTSTQYENVTHSYARLTRESENDGQINTRKFQKDFLEITLECQSVYERLKVIYNLSRHIVFVYMFGDTIGMVSMPYLIVMCYKHNGSSIYDSDILAFLWTLCVVGIQCHLYCSLFQQVNERKESINFGLYSCNWTLLNVQQKKLILFAMQMNNSNRLKMNVTPTKHIDLPMLASIVQSSYSVTSVMIKSDMRK